MIIGHRFDGNFSQSDKDFLRRLGIVYEYGVEVDDGPTYDKIIERLGPKIKEYGAGTIYDKDDEDNCDLLSYGGSGTLGYPQPEDDFGYLPLTYDITNYCTHCGGGAVQKAPFRLSRIPKTINQKTYTLQWLHDVWFVHKDLYESLFKPLGIRYWPVLQHKTGNVIDGMVQLQLPTAESGMDLTGQPFEQCTHCSRIKYHAGIAGYVPPFKGPTGPYPVFKSREGFGSGHSTFNFMFLTQEIRRELIKHKQRIVYAPVQRGTTRVHYRQQFEYNKNFEKR